MCQRHACARCKKYEEKRAFLFSKNCIITAYVVVVREKAGDINRVKAFRIMCFCGSMFTTVQSSAWRELNFHVRSRGKSLSHGGGFLSGNANRSVQ